MPWILLLILLGCGVLTAETQGEIDEAIERGNIGGLIALVKKAADSPEESKRRLAHETFLRLREGSGEAGKPWAARVKSEISTWALENGKPALYPSVINWVIYSDRIPADIKSEMVEKLSKKIAADSALRALLTTGENRDKIKTISMLTNSKDGAQYISVGAEPAQMSLALAMFRAGAFPGTTMIRYGNAEPVGFSGADQLDAAKFADFAINNGSPSLLRQLEAFRQTLSSDTSPTRAAVTAKMLSKEGISPPTRQSILEAAYSQLRRVEPPRGFNPDGKPLKTLNLSMRDDSDLKMANELRSAGLLTAKDLEVVSFNDIPVYSGMEERPRKGVSFDPVSRVRYPGIVQIRSEKDLDAVLNVSNYEKPDPAKLGLWRKKVLLDQSSIWHPKTGKPCPDLAGAIESVGQTVGAQ